MPRALRKVVDRTDAPERAVAHHLWTGGRSLQRLNSALSLVAVQTEEGKADQTEFNSTTLAFTVK